MIKLKPLSGMDRENRNLPRSLQGRTLRLTSPLVNGLTQNSDHLPHRVPLVRKILAAMPKRQELRLFSERKQKFSGANRPIFKWTELLRPGVRRILPKLIPKQTALGDPLVENHVRNPKPRGP